MKEHQIIPATRREFVGIAVAGIAAATIGSDRILAQGTPTAEDGVETALAPNWTFSVFRFQDPYAGAIQVPQEQPPGMRFTGAEVEIVNGSDQGLAFTPIDLRLRTLDGIEYRGGSAIGTDPTINPRNLNPGERSRGWVLFTVPAESEADELVYLAPQSQFRIALQGDETM